MKEINGVSFENWACACGNISAGMSKEEVFTVLGISSESWENINSEWTQNLSSIITQDPTKAIQYAGYLSNPKQGKFAEMVQNANADLNSELTIPDFNTFQEIFMKLNDENQNEILTKYGLTPDNWNKISNHYNQTVEDLTKDLTLKEAHQKGNYLVIKNKILNSPKEYKELGKFDQQNLVNELARGKYFSIIFDIINANLEEMDLSEIDKLEGSFVETVFKGLSFPKPVPFPKNESDLILITEPDIIQFIDRFCDHIKNIDENTNVTSLFKWAITKKLPLPIDALELLIQKGCSVSIYDASDNSLLHYLLPENYISFLLNHGLDPNHKNKGGVTPLELALSNNAEVVKTLLENGADPQHKNKQGNSLFYVALMDLMNPDLYDLLCKYDTPDFEDLNKDETSFLFNYIKKLDEYSSNTELKCLEKLLEQGADLSISCMYYGEPTTPLKEAVKKPFAVFEIVMNHFYGDINETDDNGNTLLHQVCGYNINFQAEDAVQVYKKAKFLIEKGADASIRNNEDKTALDLAVTDNLKEKTVKLLLN